jgi:hypothetical protein
VITNEIVATIAYDFDIESTVTVLLGYDNNVEKIPATPYPNKFR